MKFNIYLDLDGVLADFNGHFKNTKESEGLSFEDYETKYGEEKAWFIINSIGQSWWESEPFLKEGKKLWNYLNTLNDIKLQILSSPSKDKSSYIGKENWVKKHLGNVKLILTTDKWKFAKSKNDILIDDLIENIQLFLQNGGAAIMYKNFEDTQQKLELMGVGE